MNDEGSSHFWFIFYMFWELLYLTSKISLFSIFLDVYLHGKYQNVVCIFLLEINLIKKYWSIIRSEHYSNIITWYYRLIQTSWEHYRNIIWNIITWQHQSWTIFCSEQNKDILGLVYLYTSKCQKLWFFTDSGSSKDVF